MTQRRRAEVHVSCDVPGCLETWQHVGEREHSSGRPGDWLHVWATCGSLSPEGWPRDLDFCPKHARGEDMIQVLRTMLIRPKSEDGGHRT